MTKSIAATKRRVLLVDDEPQMTEALRLGLRRAPFEVLSVNSAKEALSLLEREQVDVIVSDEQMPAMSGSELLTRVRELYPETIRIILTGQASLDVTIHAINHAAVFRFLTKPCRPDELQECIETAFRAREERDLRRTRPDDDQRRLLTAGLDTLWMAFQPIISARTREVFGYEALLRTETDGIGPGELIGAAEALDCVLDLEARVRGRIAGPLAAAPPGIAIFVNLHPITLTSSDLFDNDNPLHPYASMIVLEITERAPLDGVLDLRAKIDGLRNLGYRIALDDLGAGYAGLTSFASLQPDIVKFDLSLVRGIDQSTTRSKLVASIATLCQELGITCVAEGIETAAERDKTIELGCELLQGFLLGRPEKPFSTPGWGGD